MLKYIFATLGILFIVHPIQAQSDSTIQAITLNPIVITGNKTATPLSNTLISVAVLDNKQINSNASRSVPEMLMQIPGVWMQKTGHAGGSPFIKGLTGNQIVQLIDGIRLNNATFRYGPNQYLSTIDPYAVSQAEVVKSAFSTLYGSDAIGGVVQILLKDPTYSDTTASFHGSVTGKTISHSMEYSGNISLQYHAKSLAWDVIATNSDFGNSIAANRFEQKPTSYKQQSFHSKFKAMLLKQMELTVCFQQLAQHDVDLFDQVTQKGFSINKIEPQKRQLLYARFAPTFNLPVVGKMKFTLSRQVSDEGRNKRKTGSVILTHEYDQVITHGIQVESEKTITKKWKAISGVEIYIDKVKSEAADLNDTSKVITPKRGLYADQSSMTSISAYHQQEIQYKRFHFTAGGRLSKYSINIADAKFGDVYFNTPALTGNVGLSYMLDNNWKLTSSLSGSYRAPNISDLSSFGKFDYGVETPTPGLRPEHGINKEIALKKITNHFLLSISAFHNQLIDLIDRAKSSYLGDTMYLGERVYQKINIGKAYIYGTEAEVSFWATKKLQIAGNVTYTFGQNLSANEPMRRIPPVFGKMSVQYYMHPRLFVGMDWHVAGAQKRLASGDKSDHRINPLGTPGWGMLQLKTGINLQPINIQAGIENLLDHSYRLHGSGIDGYGRMGWIRVQVVF